MKQKIYVGIIGGAGYAAGELIRILLNHPNIEIAFVNSASHAGKKVYEVHTDLIGETELRFYSKCPFDKLHVLFLCLAHGESKKFMEQNDVPKSLKVIDLSQDFRLQGFTLDDGEEDWVYGLSEQNKIMIKSSNRVANPGCFATAIQLAVLPLASREIIINDLHVNAITGSTGAGQKPTETSHFSWRNNNISVYKAFEHQHLEEILQGIKISQPSFDYEINFIPVRGNFTRGIFASVYTEFDERIEYAQDLYKKVYEQHPFVQVVDKNPDLKQVVNTNKCILYLEKHGNKLLIVSMIDNLLKGASGQAVQNMNIMFGLDEKTGLNLKSVAF